MDTYEKANTEFSEIKNGANVGDKILLFYVQKYEENNTQVFHFICRRSIQDLRLAR